MREVAEIFNISPGSVCKTLKKYKLWGTFKHAGRNGRPSIASAEILDSIKTNLRKNNKTSLRKMAVKIEEETKMHVSHVTAKNILNNINFFAYPPIKKPFISEKNIKLRFNNSIKWLKMNEEALKKIVFSDESKFNLFYNDGKSFVWREPRTGLNSENLSPTIKHGGISVMVWACFSYHGKGRLVFIDGIMDAAKYCCILSDNLFASVDEMGLSDFIFQQDNDPKHTSRLAKEYLAENNVRMLEWPPQSPDMNPIENLWSIVKEDVAKKQPKNKSELKSAIIESWNQIPKTILEKLSLSFKKRALSLYRCKGKHIKY